MIQQVIFSDPAYRQVLDTVHRHDVNERVLIAYGNSHLGNYAVHHVTESVNEADDPTENFRVALPTEESAFDDYYIVGVIHTHVGRHPVYPSPNDLAGAIKAPTLFHGVFHARKRTMVFYDYSGLFSRNRWR